MSPQPAVVPSSTPAHGHLFVSTALDAWFTEHAAAFARDVQIDDTAYRLLNPEYYAWLRSKMNLAKMTAEAGQLGRNEYDELRRRFNAMNEWAIALFGERALIDAIRNLDARIYAPPVPEPEEPPLSPRPVDVALENAVTMVDAITEKAMALGWTRESLYRISTSPFGFNCGLAHFLNASDRIGEVTTYWIEIIRSNGVRNSFYNPNVDQPWIRRIR